MKRLPVGIALFTLPACRSPAEKAHDNRVRRSQADAKPAAGLTLEAAKKLEAGFLQIAEAICGLTKRECAARPDGAICRGLVDKYK
jgi:hypothetical protein